MEYVEGEISFEDLRKPDGTLDIPDCFNRCIDVALKMAVGELKRQTETKEDLRKIETFAGFTADDGSRYQIAILFEPPGTVAVEDSEDEGKLM